MSTNNGLYKRLIREMQDLKNYKDIKKLQMVFPFDGDPLPKNVSTYYVNKDTPYIRIKIDNNELIIAFPSAYPFKPPTLLINNIDYHSCYKINQKLSYGIAALAELHRKYKMYCLCCETAMCNGSSKWSPSIHICHILDEYKKFKEIKRYLMAYCALLQLNTCLGNILPTEMIELIRDYI